MNVDQALAALGANRTIWIDDHFNQSPQQLADMLVSRREVALRCTFPELGETLDRGAYLSEEDLAGELAQVLSLVQATRLAEIKDALLAREREEDGDVGKELTTASVLAACALLRVGVEDRWTFDDAAQKLADQCRGGDASVAYVIDLKDSASHTDRGLEVLVSLAGLQSCGTAFILTHEATVDSEAKVEARIRKQLRDGGAAVDAGAIPVCVVAKARLMAEDGGEAEMTRGLGIAIKRAGLRRSVNEVVQVARVGVADAFNEAADMLLTIPPEQLDRFVVERGYREGVSELHVVERALTAHIGHRLRQLFASEEAVRDSTMRLRSLRGVALTDAGPTVAHENLEAFRREEVWESAELINGGLAPIFCGDVFEFDRDEQATRRKEGRFLLLGQPCDLSLRPDGAKDRGPAFLVPMRMRAEGSESKMKEQMLPFRLDGRLWSCDFRETTEARMAILDLASFREDGRVRVDEGQAMSSAFLAGQAQTFAGRTEAARTAIERCLASSASVVGFHPDLQLTFKSAQVFKHVHHATFEKRSQAKAGGVVMHMPNRVTWRLRRCGRVRMPYAAYMLDTCLGVMSRDAFDMDFTSEAGAVRGRAIRTWKIQGQSGPSGFLITSRGRPKSLRRHPPIRR